MTAFVVGGLAVMLGQIVKGTTGFGSALVGIPILALVVGPREAIFVVVATDLVGGLLLAWEVRFELRFALVAAVITALLPGQWIGTELLTRLPEAWVALVMGVAVSGFALEMIVRPVRAGRGSLTDMPEDRTRLLGLAGVAGFASGVMGGLVGAGGPPLVVFMRHFFADRFFRSHLIGIFLVSGATLLVMLMAKGAVEGDTWKLIAAVLVPMLFGNRIGAALAGKLHPVAFGRVVGVVMLLAGGGLVIPALERLGLI